MAGSASSTPFQAQAAHFRFSPDSGHIAASHRSASKSAHARGAAHGGELHQAAGAAALVAADERGVTRRSRRRCNALSVAKAKSRGSFRVRFSPPASDRLLPIIQVPHASDKRIQFRILLDRPANNNGWRQQVRLWAPNVPQALDPSTKLSRRASQ